MILTILLSACLHAPPRFVPQSTNVVDVYILTGQSNSLGTTGLEGTSPKVYGPEPHPADAFARLYWSNVESTNSVYPPFLYGDSGGAAEVMQMQQGDGIANRLFWGPEHGFTRAFLERHPDGNPILVIKASRGGGGNTLWHKPTFDADANAGHMWGHVRDTVDEALTALVTDQRAFRVRGLLYLQGESNSTGEAVAADTRLAGLISELASDIDSNHPGAADGMQVVVGEIAASTSTTAREQTTLRQMDLAAGSATIAFARTADLPLKADNIHFGRDAKLTIGRRFAAAFLGTAQAFDVGNYDARGGDPILPSDVNSPTQLGFSELGSGAGVVQAGVIDVATPAWRIFDNSSAANPGYQRSLGAVDFRAMFHSGWSFRVEVKVVAGGGLALWSVTPGNDPGWGVAGGPGNMNGFVVDRVGSNELQVSLWGAPIAPIGLGPGSASQFHTLELRGAGGSPLCDLYIDGVRVSAGIDITQNPGLGGFTDRVLFNSGQTGGIGRDVYWAEVSLRSEPMLLQGG